MSFINPAIDIALICIGLVILSQLLQRKLVDREKLKETQKKMKEQQKKIKELMKKNDEKSKKEIERTQKEMFSLMNESMQATMRQLFITLPLFLGVFWFLGMTYGGIAFNALFPLPQFNQFSLLNPGSWIPVGLSLKTGWLKSYFFCYLITSIVIGVILKIYEKSKKRGA